MKFHTFWRSWVVLAVAANLYATSGYSLSCINELKPFLEDGNISRTALEAKVKETATKANARYVNPPPNFILKRVRALRDDFRKWLQVKQGHEYPIIALDDATAVRAHAIASDSMGALPEEMKGTINLDEVKADIEATLKSVEGFSASEAQFVDDCATMTAQVEVMTDLLREKKVPKNGNFNVEIPVVKTVNGKQELETLTQYFGNKEQFEIYIQNLKKKLDDKIAPKFLSMNEADTRAVGQVIGIKRLETFRNEFLRQQKLNGDKPFPPDVDAWMKRIESLTTSQGYLKAEYKAPSWAAEKVKWLQLHGELKTLFYKTFPTKLDKVKQSEIVQFVANLSADDKRALGLWDMAEADEILKRTKWAQVSVGTSVPTAAGGLSAYQIWGDDAKVWMSAIYHYWMGGRTLAVECAKIEEFEPFTECLNRYMEKMFPGTYFLSVTERSKLGTPEGVFKDPDMIQAAKKIIDQRDRYLKRLQIAKSNASVTTSTAKSLGADKKEVLNKIIQLQSDTDYVKQLTEPTTEGKPSYLEQIYGGDFTNRKEKIVQLLKEPDNSAIQRQLLYQLQSENPNLYRDIKDILDRRWTYKNPGGIGNFEQKSPAQPGSAPVGIPAGPLGPFDTIPAPSEAPSRH